MRYRRLTADGDYSFGQGAANFYIDTPDAVGQAAVTRLRLLTKEWFLNTEDGTPYDTEVLGKTTKKQRDFAIRARIAGTPGVFAVTSFSSVAVGRQYHVNATIKTIYGTTIVDVTI